MKRHLLVVLLGLISCTLILTPPFLPVGTSGWFGASCFLIAALIGAFALLIAANQ